MKKLLLTLFVYLFCINIFGHLGGHYHQSDINSLHHWDIQQHQEKLIGNFMMFDNNSILIEGIDGKIFKIPYSIIQGNDKKYVDVEINRINALNGITTSSSPNSYFHFFIFTISIALSLFFLMIGIQSRKRNATVFTRFAYSILALFFLAFSIVACKKNKIIETIIPDNTNQGIAHTSPTFIDSAFEPYKPAIATSWDSNYFHVSSNGFPNHNMMIGITSWQQQVPIPQFYIDTNSWSIPLKPEYAVTPMSTRSNFMKGAVAIAANGIPIFNALNNRGEDSYAIGELDHWGGHCGKADDYHYHAAPLHLETTSGLKPIAFALDGFAVYGSKEPDGSAMQALDSCHGHLGSNAVYHYHGTATYPYVVGAMKGKVTLDPTTPAPENQILPQAFASSLRPATSPLRGAVITDFVSTGLNQYLLTYTIGTKTGTVEYYWDNNNNYTYILTDTAGTAVTQNYHRVRKH